MYTLTEDKNKYGESIFNVWLNDTIIGTIEARESSYNRGAIVRLDKRGKMK